MAATMKDIARETGLGLATISKYFNGGQVRPQNRIKIEQAAALLNFMPNDVARSLKTRHSKTIGVIIPELNNAFITSIITIMEDMLRKQNYAVIVCDCRSASDREAEAVKFLMQKRVDGLINMPTDPSGSHLTPALRAGIPVVLVDRLLTSLCGKVSAVIVDNVAAAECGVRHLLELGHRKIGLVLGERGLYTTQCRQEGYLKAMLDYGVPAPDGLIRYGGYSINGGYQSIRELLSQPEKPTAVFITNFEMTLGGVMALNEMGISIPDKLSVIGFDKLDLFGAIFPFLSLVKQPQNAIAEQAAQLMLSHVIQGESYAPREVILGTQMLIRGSTAPLSNRNDS